MKFYLTQTPRYGDTRVGRKLLKPEGYIYPLSVKEFFDERSENPPLIDKKDITFWPDNDDMFVLPNNNVVEKGKLLDGIGYVEKITRNLNTAVDVYFTYEDIKYSLRFQDWNVFSVWSDERAFEELKLYIAKNQE